MKNGAVIALIIGGSGIVIGGTYLTFRVVRKNGIMERLDEIYKDPSNEDAVGGLDKLLVSEVFDKRTFQRSGKAIITRTGARERAKEIWDNYSKYFESDTSAIIEAFDNLWHLHDVSKIAYEFYQSYGEELLTVLEVAFGKINSKNSILIGKIEQLPNN